MKGRTLDSRCWWGYLGTLNFHEKICILVVKLGDFVVPCHVFGKMFAIAEFYVCKVKYKYLTPANNYNMKTRHGRKHMDYPLKTTKIIHIYIYAYYTYMYI